MSLDVYLYAESPPTAPTDGTGIFFRHEGKTVELSRAEWDKRFPGCEPFVAKAGADTRVYDNNITHNLNKMADAAGIYEPLWRPDEIGITKAGQLIEPLTTGLERLRADPEKFKAYNPSNGWGTYEGLVAFVESYLAACKDYPDAEIGVSR